mmetsp:Transcript_25592/g.48469  ORF Transcript_25592/g.48469 Transcript_25592/m.48469 type:complete len:159 (-) Transcript_25592:188-664(-)
MDTDHDKEAKKEEEKAKKAKALEVQGPLDEAQSHTLKVLAFDKKRNEAEKKGKAKANAKVKATEAKRKSEEEFCQLAFEGTQQYELAIALSQEEKQPRRRETPNSRRRMTSFCTMSMMNWQPYLAKKKWPRSTKLRQERGHPKSINTSLLLLSLQLFQ